MCGVGANESKGDIEDSSNVNDTYTASISLEEEKLYSHRFENGYDLYDPKYIRWLSIHHPIAASVISNEPEADLQL